MNHILDWLFCKCSNQSTIVSRANFVSPVATGMELVDLNTPMQYKITLIKLGRSFYQRKMTPNQTIYFHRLFYAKKIITLQHKNKGTN